MRGILRTKALAHWEQGLEHQLPEERLIQKWPDSRIVKYVKRVAQAQAEFSLVKVGVELDGIMSLVLQYNVK